MNLIEALILGIIQGLTEFLPVSSSGHLEIGEALLGIKAEKSLIFTVVVHGATVLSTLVIFRKEILEILRGLFKFEWNEETKYTLKLIISMIPVLFLGLFFKEEVEAFFDGRIVFVGSMLIFTAILLASTRLIKTNKREISYLDSFIIGLAQAVAVLPGISRSGSTIATGLLLGDKKESVTRFSFLMVLVPIIGANLMDLKDYHASTSASIGPLPLLVGFIAAFIAGLLACKWMIGIVKKGNLLYFAIYCLIIGLIAIFAG
jgi:undecaprenyl-diphosphatase